MFINSDPDLIRFFLRFLDGVGIERERVSYRVQIHENADIRGAERFWLEVTGADPTQFKRSTLKRHNPKTVRTNVGDDYHGCLRLDVVRSAELYQRIAGWAAGTMRGVNGVS